MKKSFAPYKDIFPKGIVLIAPQGGKPLSTVEGTEKSLVK